jgi:outer membrane lipoprotein-sorting protein
MLDGKQLMQMLNMAKLANITGSYTSIFDKVEIFLCTNTDRNFYVLKCRNTEGSTFNIYVDAATFFVRRLQGKVKVGSAAVDYTSDIIAYDRHQGVLLPQKTITRQNGQKQEVKIIDYKLNVKFSNEDFLPPIF